jgi:hypothetical protein
MTSRSQSWLVALAVGSSLLLAGCGSSGATLSSIIINPSPVRVGSGGTSQLTVTGTYSDGTRAPITSGVAFSTGSATIAEVSSSGVVTGIGGGSTTVTAQTSGQTATVTVVVTAGPPTLESIALSPPAVPLAPGRTAQLTAIGTYTNGTELNLTSACTFATSSSGVATVSSAGLVTSVAVGSATITATHTATGLVSSSVITVSVAPPTLNSIAVLPSPMPLVVDGSGNLTVTGTLSDSSTVNLTTESTFSSANFDVATVTSAGLVSAHGLGSAIITATHTPSGKVATTTVSVTAGPVPVITSFAASPTSISPGGSSTLSWNVSGATSLSINQGVGVVTGTSIAVNPSVTTTYTLTATNASGPSTATATVTVSLPLPVINSFAAAPTSISAGGTSTLSWSVTGATSLSIDQGVGVVTGTSKDVTPSATTIYTLTATNATGNATATATVTVTSPASWPTITFDDPTVTYTLTGFGGAEDSTVVTDPVGGTNKVAKVVKSAIAETWAGTTVSTGASQSVPTIPFAAGATSMTVRVYSPDAGIQVRLKVENAADPTRTCETEATVTTANGWQTLTFNFANQAAGTAALDLAATYNKVSIFFNFGVTGAAAGAKTYYFDDIAFGAGSGGGGGGGATFSTITFDDAAVTYTLTGFGGAEDSTVVTDPVGGTNKVAKVVKSAIAETWAGTTASTGASFSVPTIPLATGSTTMTVRVYSPDAGIQVRLKVEVAGDPTRSCETEATVTTANGWQTLTFDFANQATGTAAFNPAYTFNKVNIFFNFGVTGATAGAKTYYFDDIAKP